MDGPPVEDVPTVRANSSAKKGLPAARVWIYCTAGSVKYGTCETIAPICSSLSGWSWTVSTACSRCRSVKRSRKGWLLPSSFSRHVPMMTMGRLYRRRARYANNSQLLLSAHCTSSSTINKGEPSLITMSSSHVASHKRSCSCSGDCDDGSATCVSRPSSSGNNAVSG